LFQANRENKLGIGDDRFVRAEIGKPPGSKRRDVVQRLDVGVDKAHSVSTVRGNEGALVRFIYCRIPLAINRSGEDPLTPVIECSHRTKEKNQEQRWHDTAFCQL
jgi:hypothetical protein